MTTNDKSHGADVWQLLSWLPGPVRLFRWTGHSGSGGLTLQISKTLTRRENLYVTVSRGDSGAPNGGTSID